MRTAMSMNTNAPEDEGSLAARLAAYRAKLDNEPNNGTFWLEYGDFVDEEYQMPGEVIRAYENAARLLPKKDLRLRLGHAYIQAGEADCGLTLIKDSVAEDPRSHGFCFLADAFLQLEDYQSARKAAQRAVDEDPGFEEAHYLLGEATRRFSRKDAIACFRAAVERDESYALAWQALERELAADDDSIDEAISALKRAIDLNPDDGWAMAYLANAFWRTDCTGQAEHWYRRAIEVYPDCEEMRRWYSQFRKETGSGLD